MRKTRIGVAAFALLAVLIPGSAHATTDPGDPLDQVVADDEEIGADDAVVDRGHMDIGPRIIDGEWTIMARDDSVSPPVWRYPEDVVVHLGSDSLLAMPDDEEFAFVPAEPGDDLYVIPQTQLTEVAWLGWNTQDPNVVEQIAGGATLRFHGYEGPGGFTLFLQNGNFAPPTLLWDGDNPEPQDIWAEANTHVHANWIFTDPGIYYLDIEVLATLNDGTEVSDRGVVAVAVGDETDPEAAFAAVEQQRQDERNDPEEAASSGAETIPEDQTATNGEAPSGEESASNERVMGDEKDSSDATEGSGESESAGDTTNSAPGSGEEDGNALSTGLIISAVVGILLLVGALYGVIRSRRARNAVMDNGSRRETRTDGEL